MNEIRPYKDRSNMDNVVAKGCVWDFIHPEPIGNKHLPARSDNGTHLIDLIYVQSGGDRKS